jgi:hypothetical protein
LRRERNIEKIGNSELVQRLNELVAAKQAIEVEHIKVVSEFIRRRVALVRAGKPVTGALAEVAPLTHNENESLARRERVAAEHFEADEAQLRDGNTARLLSR